MKSNKIFFTLATLIVLLQSTVFVLGAPPCDGLDYTHCSPTPGCKWDYMLTPARCVTGTTDCSLFTITNCGNALVCHWDPDPSPGACKSGSTDPAKCIISDETTCKATADCTWNNGHCEKTSTTPTDCTKITDPTACINAANCYWIPGTLIPYVPGTCKAASTTPTDCTTIKIPVQCTETPGCTWNNIDIKCIYGVTDCSLFDVVTACSGECEWKDGQCVNKNGYTPGEGTYKIFDDYVTADCTCDCQGKKLAAVAIYSDKEWTHAAWSDQFRGHYAIQQCHDQCARNCGSLTACSSNDKSVCGTCCQTHCSGVFQFPCIESCSSSCAFSGLVNGIVELIYIAAGVIGALMIVIFGIKMLAAKDPDERTAAKRSIMYVIIGLVIIILAATLVGLFMNPVTTPQP